jgi:hypothetical protein
MEKLRRSAEALTCPLNPGLLSYKVSIPGASYISSE